MTAHDKRNAFARPGVCLPAMEDAMGKAPQQQGEPKDDRRESGDDVADGLDNEGRPKEPHPLDRAIPTPPPPD